MGFVLLSSNVLLSLLLFSVVLLFVVDCCWLVLSVCLRCVLFHEVVGCLLFVNCCLLFFVFWLDWNWTGGFEIEWIDLIWIELIWNWIGWMVVDRRQSKLCLFGLGSGGFCSSVSQCVVFVVVVVIYCIVDDSFWLLIVDCPLSIVNCQLLLSVCLSCELLHDVVGHWSPLLMYWIGDWFGLNWNELNWNWTSWIEIELNCLT